jgi:sarcosine oxidase gamma subunit
VLELAATEATVVLCCASPEAVDAAMALSDVVRVAPDEAMVLGPSGTAETLIATTTERIEALDGTDGWTICTLEGDAARNAFTYLSALELPQDGFVQGDVAHVHAKVVVRGDRLHVLVPAMWGAHLRERIVSDCAPLGVHERADAEPWVVAKRPRRKRT